MTNDARFAKLAEQIVGSLGFAVGAVGAGVVDDIAHALLVATCLKRPWECALLIRPDRACLVLRSDLALELKARGQSDAAKLMRTTPADALLVVTLSSKTPTKDGPARLSAFPLAGIRIGPRSMQNGSIEGQVP